MKPPYKSKRFWGGVMMLASILVKALPPEWTQPVFDYYNRVVGQMTPEQTAFMIGAFWSLYGGVVADERIDWRKLLPGGKK